MAPFDPIPTSFEGGMSDGALMGLPVPPFDYEKDPLVTSAVKLNTDNLKKAFTWLVQNVQDQQQTLVKHSQRLDELSVMPRSYRNRSGIKSVKSIRSTVQFADNQDAAEAESEGSEGSPDENPVTGAISEAFRNSLSTELVDMKINAMNRKSIARISSLDTDRERILADVACFQKDFSGRFQEADKRIHADLASTTNKLFEKLNRISEDVLARIQKLESRVNSNAEAVEAMRSAPRGQDSATVRYVSASPSSAFAAKAGKPLSSGESVAPVTPRFDQGPENQQVVAFGEALQEQPITADRALHSRHSQFGSIGTAPSSVGSPSRPGTTGTVGAMSTEEEGSIPSTTDSRKPAWKPAIRREMDPSPAMPEGISSWKEVQDTLATISKAQRQALEEARHDLADMSEFLQAESTERMKVQDECDSLKNAQMSTEASFNDLKAEYNALKEAQRNAERIVEGAFAGISQEMMALQIGLDQVSMASPSKQEKQPPEVSANTAEKQASLLAEPSVKDLVHGTVRKLSKGQSSSGIQIQEPSEVRQASTQEAKAWLNHDGSADRDEDANAGKNWKKNIRNAVPSTSFADAGAVNEAEVAVQAVSSSAGVGGSKASEAEVLNRLEKRINTLEGALPQMESANNARSAALEGKLVELKQTIGGKPIAATAPTVSQARGDAFGPRFESRLFEVEERLRVIEGLPKSQEGSGAVRPAGESRIASSPSKEKIARSPSKEKIAHSPSKEKIASPPSKEPPNEEIVRQAAQAAVADSVDSCHKVTAEMKELAESTKSEFQRLRQDVLEALATSQNSQEGVRGEVTDLAGTLQGLQKEINKFGERTNEILTRLFILERKPASASSPKVSSVDVPDSAGSKEAQALEAPALPLLPVLLDTVLDKHPLDMSHLLDPQNSGGQTPLPFVSRRGLQQAVDGLTDNFRAWLDAIYQSIITALQNKADSSQVDDIARQVQDAAGRASESVASFAKRALGGKCASCDAPLNDDSIMWKRPAPGGAKVNGNWMPKASAGARHSIRPPSSSMGSLKGPIGPAFGPSKLPKLQDLRHTDVNEPNAVRDLSKVSSEPQLRIVRRQGER